MKTIKILKAVVIFTFIPFLASCGSDDASEEKINEVYTNSQRFEIANTKMFNDGTYNGVTEFELFFTSSGVIIDDNENVTGNGDALLLRLFSSQDTGLPSGNYLYNNQDSGSFILNRGVLVFGFGSSKGDQNKELDIESGSVLVSVENNIYTIKINVIGEEGKVITGFYNGVIDIL